MDPLTVVTPDHDRPEAEHHPLARPATLRLLRGLGIAAAVLLVAAGLLVHGHPHFALDAVAGFYAWFGFVAAAACLGGALLWGGLLRREEDRHD